MEKVKEFICRKPPKDIWELNEQSRQMETRATITVTVAAVILVLNIALLVFQVWIQR